MVKEKRDAVAKEWEQQMSTNAAVRFSRIDGSFVCD
jgi:hypothetical protein